MNVRNWLVQKAECSTDGRKHHAAGSDIQSDVTQGDLFKEER